MKKLLLVFAAAASLWSAPGLAAPPKSVEATYELHRNDVLIAHAKESFTQSNGKYHIESAASPAGLATLLSKEHITRVSRGTVTAGGLRPEFFEEKRTSGSKAKTRTARFDWAGHKIALSFDDKNETAPLPPGTQDSLSLPYQFLFSAPKKDLVSVTLTDGRRVESYQYRFVDEVDIATPAGKFSTLHYAYTDPQGERSTEIWLAKEKSFYPVKLVQKEEGTTLDQRLVALKFH